MIDKCMSAFPVFLFEKPAKVLGHILLKCELTYVVNLPLSQILFSGAYFENS